VAVLSYVLRLMRWIWVQGAVVCVSLVDHRVMTCGGHSCRTWLRRLVAAVWQIQQDLRVSSCICQVHLELVHCRQDHEARIARSKVAAPLRTAGFDLSRWYLEVAACSTDSYLGHC
jgi:hypothetical protein